ncbi:hypothetical protein FMM05_15410 [Flavobacterium zepuense]|uniref:Uncharacterized protein n=1 Tax=Flavobacterium zepuense TaxID=2593302 RepID=A0A552UXZ3_9FLAO|nr:hypothetical protein [Flavobacterium zepuense]TRW23079.1 hypothetical protein FMM05_15410 [Flavobacterium zepuense]
MLNVIYSGTGTYDQHTYQVDYRVYLPVITTGQYEFITDKIYNMSCKKYPNTVLLFMKIVNGPNPDLSGCTEDPGVEIEFNISATNLISVDSNCTPLDYTKIVYVVVMHDDTCNEQYAKDAAYCKAPVINRCIPGQENNVNDASIANKGNYGGPNKSKYGKLYPSSL